MKTVTAGILVKDHRVLIAKRNASDKLPNKWEFPGGKLENGEDVDDICEEYFGLEPDYLMEFLNM